MILKLKVKNFGAVRKADISFGNLTVFTGQHNTGKTYLALLSHSLMRALEYTKLRLIWMMLGLKVKDVDEFKREFEIVLRDSIRNELLSNFYISNVAELIHKRRKSSSITFGDNAISANFEILKNGQIEIVSLNFDQEYLNFIERTLELELHIEERVHLKELLKKFGVSEELFTEIASQTYYQIEREKWSVFIPTERLMVISNLLPSIQLIVQSARAMQPVETLRRLMKPIILDYISLLLSLMQFLRSHKKFKRSFKEDILNGEVRINPETFEITYVANGVKVPITQTSSGISQLAGIILALAKEIYTPELVVIEEPEMNIHPNHQLKVAEFLAKLSNKAKVLITTHSDYLITKLVHLYIKKKIPLLKLYFFNEDGIVEEVEIGEFGEFSIKTFDEVISKLSGEALELVESLKEG